MKGKTNDETKQEGRAIVWSDLDLDFFFPGNNQRERKLPAKKSKMLVLRDDVRVESSIRVQSPKACNK